MKSQHPGDSRFVSRETRDRLKAYEALVRKWQKSINLVAPSTLDDLWDRHIEDSLQLLEKTVGSDRIVYGTNFAGWDQPESYELDARSAQWTVNTRNLFRVGEVL